MKERTMRYPAFVRTAALALPVALLSSGVAWSQTQSQPRTLSDAAPLPAQERTSSGAVILMDQPVLAQREQMEAAAARAPDTRTLGAGPARQLQRALTRSERERGNATDAAPPPVRATPK
jgi:hypothetical protein